MRISLLSDYRIGVLLSVIVALVEARLLASGAVWGQWLGLAWFILYGIYCVQNFLACREVHCAITGPGFLLAALLAVLRLLGIANYDPMFPWTVFAVAALGGKVVEFLYERRHGSSFLRR